LSAANDTFGVGSGRLRVVYAGTGAACQGQPGHAILPSINVDGRSIFKRNSSVLVKFRVGDAIGASIGTPGVVSAFNLVQVIEGTTSRVVNEGMDSTKTYVYRIALNDGSAIDFRFGLR
jgi:hypothetical protein